MSDCPKREGCAAVQIVELVEDQSAQREQQAAGAHEKAQQARVGGEHDDCDGAYRPPTYPSKRPRAEDEDSEHCTNGAEALART